MFMVSATLIFTSAHGQPASDTTLPIDITVFKSPV